MRPNSLKAKGLEKRYAEWLVTHPDAISWEQFKGYLDNVDEFGRRVPATALAIKCKTTETTMLKWIAVYKEQNGADK